MATVSFRVPDDVRKRMADFDVDWAHRLRELLEQELAREQMRVGLEEARRLRAKYAKRAKGYSMSAEVIRSRHEDH